MGWRKPQIFSAVFDGLAKPRQRQRDKGNANVKGNANFSANVKGNVNVKGKGLLQWTRGKD